MIIRSRLIAALKRSGKRQADVARDCDVSTAAVALWFSDTGKSTINVRHANAIKLAGSLGVTLDYLIGGEESAARVVKPTSANVAPGDIVDKKPTNNLVELQSYELWSGASDIEIRSMCVPRSWIESRGYSEKSVINIEMPDNSQADRILRSDVVGINTDWGHELHDDKLYAILLGGRYTLRKVAIKANDDVILQCANSKYRDDLIIASEVNRLDVLGEYVGFLGIDV